MLPISSGEDLESAFTWLEKRSMSRKIHGWPVRAHTRVGHRGFVAVAVLTAFTALWTVN
jgi:hypothetical protein